MKEKLKTSFYTLLIGLMFLASVYVFLIEFSKQANDYRLLDERIAQARWAMEEVKK